ncbi:MAG: hypothetical protein V4577_06220 [Bacteroidota bacterium]
MYLKAKGSTATVITNHNNEYYGGHIPQDALVPRGDAKLGGINFDQWFSSQPVKS